MNWGNLSGLLLAVTGDDTYVDVPILGGFVDALLDTIFHVIQLFPHMLYLIWQITAFFVDLIENAFRKLAGLSDYYVGGEQQSGDMASAIISNSTVQQIFGNLVAVATAVMVFFTIIKIIQEQYKEKDGGNPYLVVYKMFKGMLMFFFVTAACLVGLYAGGVVFKALDDATGGGGSSISGKIFRAMAYEANRARHGQYQGIAKETQNQYYNQIVAKASNGHSYFWGVKKDAGVIESSAVSARAAAINAANEWVKVPDYAMNDDGTVNLKAMGLETMADGTFRDETTGVNHTVSDSFDNEFDEDYTYTNYSISPSFDLSIVPFQTAIDRYQFTKTDQIDVWSTTVGASMPVAATTTLTLYLLFYNYIKQGDSTIQELDPDHRLYIGMNGGLTFDGGAARGNYSLNNFAAQNPMSDVIRDLGMQFMMGEAFTLLLWGLSKVPKGLPLGVALNGVEVFIPPVWMKWAANSLYAAMYAIGDSIAEGYSEEEMAYTVANESDAAWVKYNQRYGPANAMDWLVNMQPIMVPSNGRTIDIKRLAIFGQTIDYNSGITANIDRFIEAIRNGTLGKLEKQLADIANEITGPFTADYQVTENGVTSMVNTATDAQMKAFQEYNMVTDEYNATVGPLLARYLYLHDEAAMAAYLSSNESVPSVWDAWAAMQKASIEELKQAVDSKYPVVKQAADSIQSIKISADKPIYKTGADGKPSTEPLIVKQPKTDAKGEILRDEEGKIVYEDVEARSGISEYFTYNVTEANGIVNNTLQQPIVVPVTKQDDGGLSFQINNLNGENDKKGLAVVGSYLSVSTKILESAYNADVTKKVPKEYIVSLDTLFAELTAALPKEEVSTQALSVYDTPITAGLNTNTAVTSTPASVTAQAAATSPAAPKIVTFVRTMGDNDTVNVVSDWVEEIPTTIVGGGLQFEGLSAAGTAALRASGVVGQALTNQDKLTSNAEIADAVDNQMMLKFGYKYNYSPEGENSVTSGMRVYLYDVNYSDRSNVQIVNNALQIQGGQVGKASYESGYTVGYLYDFGSMNFIIGFAGIFITTGVFLNFTFGLIQRLLKLGVLYVMSPITIAFYPFDDGSKFQSLFVMPFYKNVISSYAIIISLNIFFVIWPVISSINLYPDQGAYKIPNFFIGVLIDIALISMLPQVRDIIVSMLGADNIQEKKLGEMFKSAGDSMGGADKFKAFGKAARNFAINRIKSGHKGKKSVFSRFADHVSHGKYSAGKEVLKEKFARSGVGRLIDSGRRGAIGIKDKIQNKYAEIMTDKDEAKAEGAKRMAAEKIKGVNEAFNLKLNEAARDKYKENEKNYVDGNMGNTANMTPEAISARREELAAQYRAATPEEAALTNIKTDLAATPEMQAILANMKKEAFITGVDENDAELDINAAVDSEYEKNIQAKTDKAFDKMVKAKSDKAIEAIEKESGTSLSDAAKKVIREETKNDLAGKGVRKEMEKTLRGSDQMVAWDKGKVQNSVQKKIAKEAAEAEEKAKRQWLNGLPSDAPERAAIKDDKDGRELNKLWRSHKTQERAEKEFAARTERAQKVDEAEIDKMAEDGLDSEYAKQVKEKAQRSKAQGSTKSIEELESEIRTAKPGDANYIDVVQVKEALKAQLTAKKQKEQAEKLGVDGDAAEARRNILNQFDSQEIARHEAMVNANKQKTLQGKAAELGLGLVSAPFHPIRTLKTAKDKIGQVGHDVGGHMQDIFQYTAVGDAFDAMFNKSTGGFFTETRIGQMMQFWNPDKLKGALKEKEDTERKYNMAKYDIDEDRRKQFDMALTKSMSADESNDTAVDLLVRERKMSRGDAAAEVARLRKNPDELKDIAAQTTKAKQPVLDQLLEQMVGQMQKEGTQISLGEAVKGDIRASLANGDLETAKQIIGSQISGLGSGDDAKLKRNELMNTAFDNARMGDFVKKLNKGEFAEEDAKDIGMSINAGDMKAFTDSMAKLKGSDAQLAYYINKANKDEKKSAEYAMGDLNVDINGRNKAEFARLKDAYKALHDENYQNGAIQQMAAVDRMNISDNEKHARKTEITRTFATAYDNAEKYIGSRGDAFKYDFAERYQERVAAELPSLLAKQLNNRLDYHLNVNMDAQSRRTVYSDSEILRKMQSGDTAGIASNLSTLCKYAKAAAEGDKDAEAKINATKLDKATINDAKSWASAPFGSQENKRLEQMMGLSTVYRQVMGDTHGPTDIGGIQGAKNTMAALFKVSELDRISKYYEGLSDNASKQEGNLRSKIDVNISTIHRLGQADNPFKEVINRTGLEQLLMKRNMGDTSVDAKIREAEAQITKLYNEWPKAMIEKYGQKNFFNPDKEILLNTFSSINTADVYADQQYKMNDFVKNIRGQKYLEGLKLTHGNSGGGGK